jgi:phosphoglycerate dehydrogenase-like enzyme
VAALTVAVLPASVRPLLTGRLPEWLAVWWWDDADTLQQLAPDAQIGWFDMHVKPPVLSAIRRAEGLRWLNTSYAGVDWLPLADLQARGIQLTCGRGLTAVQVAEWALLGMLAVAKGYREVVRGQDRREWLAEPPGTRQLAGSRALILGHGAIGQAVEQRLKGFEVDVTAVSSHRPQGWRSHLGEYDWIVLALPGTPQTRGIIGAAELAAMKPEAVLVNFARADCVDQGALIAALSQRRISAAVLDLTDPEPLPPEHPLWAFDNAHITMHLSGIPTPASQQRAAERFLRNCERFRASEPLEAEVDLARGY